MSQQRHKTESPHINSDTLYLLYDGACVLCRNTALAIRIKQQVKDMTLINARETHPLINKARQDGFNLNQGMLIYYQGNTFFGKHALIKLALLCQPNNLFNRLMTTLFRYRWVATAAYPLFKGLRRTLLWLNKTPPL
jgi:predicted DCC family thiol-disulfide oxidoreductase YuxK